ncbi:MAG TPA: hypothetical protein VGA65_02440, partial [Hyphomicrobium sp.]
WWSGLWKKRATPAFYGEQIEALIKSEFQSVVDELVQTAESALRGYAATTTRWSFGLCVNIVQAVKRRQNQMAEQNRPADAVGSPAEHEAEIEHEQRVKHLSEKLQQCQTVQQRLDAIFDELDNGLHSQPSSSAP